MMNVDSSKMFGFKRFAKFLLSQQHVWDPIISTLNEMEHNLFGEYTIDWYSIAGQLPDIHKNFPRTGRVPQQGKSKTTKAPWERLQK